MSKIIERCAGIDIGKRFLLCCALTGAAHEEPSTETRRVDTTVPELEKMRESLTSSWRARDPIGSRSSTF